MALPGTSSKAPPHSRPSWLPSSGVDTAGGTETTRPLKVGRYSVSSKPWPSNRHDTVAEGDEDDRSRATTGLLEVMASLEGRGAILRIREFANTDELLRIMLKPRKAKTVHRHLRLFRRLMTFIAKSPYIPHNCHPFDRQVITAWFRCLVQEGAGKYTLTAIVNTINFLSKLFDTEEDITSCKLLLKFATDWRDSDRKEVSRAAAFSKDFMRWLEFMVLDDSSTSPDRLVCGRVRLMASASVRSEDARRTPFSRMEWVFHADGRLRAVRTRAGETKTFPRHWICSALAVDPAHDGWLEETVKLLTEAHGDDVQRHDFLGPKASVDRLYWDKGPSDGHSDTVHIRLLMQETSRTGLGPVSFSSEQVRTLRLHGAKATMTSLGLHLGEDRVAVRHQGGWKGKKEDLMPDTYLRDSQVLALQLQERCLGFLRCGGLTEILPAERIFQAGSSVASAPIPSLPLAAPEAPAVVTSSSSCSSSDSETEAAVHAHRGSRLWFMFNSKSFIYHEAVAVEHPDEELVLRPSVRDGSTFHSACNRGALHAVVMTADEIAEKFSNELGPRKACVICFPRGFKSLASCEQICGRRTVAGLCVTRCAGGLGVAHSHACRTHSVLGSVTVSASPAVSDRSDDDSLSEEVTPVIPYNFPWVPPIERCTPCDPDDANR